MDSGQLKHFSKKEEKRLFVAQMSTYPSNAKMLWYEKQPFLYKLLQKDSTLINHRPNQKVLTSLKLRIPVKIELKY